MQEAKATQFNHSVTQSSIQPDFRECVAEAASLAEYFRNNGFVYWGEGSLEGLLTRKLREGYTRDNLLQAFRIFVEELKKRNNKRNHPGYYLTVLDSVFPYGPEEQGYEKVIPEK